MLKKTVTYTDFNGDEITEDVFFNLSRAELLEMELSTPGGFGKYLERIAKEEDQKEMIQEFKKLILASYGVRSEDGKKFLKSDKLREEFESSEAYSEVFMALVSDENAAADFFSGIVPKKLVDEVTAQLGATPTPIAPVAGPRRLTREETIAMNAEELRSGIAEGRYLVGDEPV